MVMAMALTYSTMAPVLGSQAPDFSLPGTDGKTYGLKTFSDRKALVVVFMCNHCPYVIAVQDRINQIARNFGPKGVALVGINSNDTKRYPDDSFENMKKRSKELGFSFPYLLDETQEVARAYGAVCTPDIFAYENTGSGFALRYQGRLDDSWKDESKVTKHDLSDALEAILAKKPVNSDQHPSMGCSIKWKP